MGEDWWGEEEYEEGVVWEEVKPKPAECALYAPQGPPAAAAQQPPNVKAPPSLFMRQSAQAQPFVPGATDPWAHNVQNMSTIVGITDTETGVWYPHGAPLIVAPGVLFLDPLQFLELNPETEEH